MIIWLVDFIMTVIGRIMDAIGFLLITGFVFYILTILYAAITLN